MGCSVGITVGRPDGAPVGWVDGDLERLGGDVGNAVMVGLDESVGDWLEYSSSSRRIRSRPVATMDALLSPSASTVAPDEANIRICDVRSMVPPFPMPFTPKEKDNTAMHKPRASGSFRNIPLFIVPITVSLFGKMSFGCSV